MPERAHGGGMIEETIDRLLALEYRSPSGPGVCVGAVLRALAHERESDGGRAMRPVLDRLCRKVAVARRLDAAYSSEWQRLDSAQLLDAASQSLLVALLLEQASALGSADLDRRGWALKCLNGAFGALALVAAGVAIPEGARLNALAAELVESVTATKRS